MLSHRSDWRPTLLLLTMVCLVVCHGLMLSTTIRTVALLGNRSTCFADDHATCSGR